MHHSDVTTNDFGKGVLSTMLDVAQESFHKDNVARRENRSKEFRQFRPCLMEGRTPPMERGGRGAAMPKEEK